MIMGVALNWAAVACHCCLPHCASYPAPPVQVASKQLASEDLGSDEVRTNVCKVFVTAHQSVEATSKRMLAQLSRRNYVTPTNYLETVREGRWEGVVAGDEKDHGGEWRGDGEWAVGQRCD